MKSIFAAVAFILCAFVSRAQEGFPGIWQGSLNVGKEIRLVFHISEDGNGKLAATMDSPDQGVTSIPAAEVVQAADSIYIGFSSFKAGFGGRLKDNNTIAGYWIQGRAFPMSIKRTDNPVQLKRPQTPEPPYSYLSEDVIYKSKDGTIQYGATITTPKGKGPFPALLLITGSGQQNRDEELFGHKPFAVIADYLTKRGYIVMRADDRGIGKTTGDVMNATSADFASDVMAGIDYLKTRAEVDVHKIGLLGHSEGGMIAPMVATQRKDIGFLVLMAAPGVRIIDLMVAQNAALLEQKGLRKDAVDAYSDLYRRFATVAGTMKDTSGMMAAMKQELAAWQKKTPDSLVAMTTGIPAENSAEQFTILFYKEFSKPWMRYFIGFDPQPNLKKLNLKVLALNGSKDMQVPADQNLEGIRTSLEKSKSKVYTVKKMDGLNHLFQHCKQCTIQEYAQLEETMSTEVLQTIGDWLDQVTK